MTLNLHAAWIGFFAGCAAGAIPGLLFHKENWLGGYSSWQRRLIRLAHISFFGLGFLNMMFYLTVRSMDLPVEKLALPSLLLVVGAVSMPLVCYLSAWRQPFRHIFFIPALSVMSAIAIFTWRLLAL